MALTISSRALQQESTAWMLEFSHLRKVPRHLLHVGHPVTADELREAAELIVHYAASVFPSASQWTQEELSIFGVTSQLWENAKGAHVCSLDGLT